MGQLQEDKRVGVKSIAETGFKVLADQEKDMPVLSLLAISLEIFFVRRRRGRLCSAVIGSRGGGLAFVQYGGAQWRCEL